MFERSRGELAGPTEGEARPCPRSADVRFPSTSARTSKNQQKALETVAGGQQVRLAGRVTGGKLVINFVACNAAFIACNAAFTACNAAFKT